MYKFQIYNIIICKSPVISRSGSSMSHLITGWYFNHLYNINSLMSAHKRPIFGSIAGFVIVMLLAGMLYAPTALASAATSDDNKGKGNSSGNACVQGAGNTNDNKNNDDKNKGKDKEKEDKDKDDKCKKHKYDGECDHKKPTIDIFNTHVNHQIGLVTVNGKASDNVGGVGIKEVKVSVDGKKFTVVSTGKGPWTFTATLTKGHHNVLAEAVDLAKNISRTHVVFTV